MNSPLWGNTPRSLTSRIETFLVSQELVSSEMSARSWRQFSEKLGGTLKDRNRGLALLNFEGGQIETGRLSEFCQRIACSIGSILPEVRNTDGRNLAPTDAIQISLQVETGYDPTFRHFTNPQLAWPLHTDRVLHADPGDFLLVAKLEEDHGSGGKIRLLHLDDWLDKDDFIKHPLAYTSLEWKGDASMAPAWCSAALRKTPGTRAPVFEQDSRFGTTIRFSDDRFRVTHSLEQERFLSDLAVSLKNVAEDMPSFSMPVGGIYVVNNRFVLHGREGFRVASQFKRRLLRICGNLR